MARLGRSNTKETQHALKDISFEVKKGEFFGIVGRNGSGKSTMLKILAGIYQPTKGKVYTQGKLVPFIELGVGFNPELTGRENVYLNGAMLGFSEKEVTAMYGDIVDFAELENFMDQKLKNYSSGMQVRLAFSMATRSEADILLIDEVLAVGDADFQRKCFEYFKSLKKNKKTVIFVSHDMDAIREYCDRAALIDKNETRLIGETSKVAEEYLKLFVTDEAGGKTSNPGQRWGDGPLTTKTIDVSTTRENIKINQYIEAAEDSNAPIVGFRLRDTTGREITGTNTKVEKLKLPSFQKGQTICIVWEFPNILSDGTYTLDPAILKADGITVSDWWDDAYSFTIKKSRSLPYAIDPTFRADILINNDRS
jgi:ABC-2 type transport system ATP-binding protein